MNKENDDPILDALADTGWALTPKVLMYNLETRHNVVMSRGTVHNRLNKLVAHGLVQKEKDTGYYSITDLGRRYLAGEADRDELE